MSRIGKKPVQLPENVEVTIEGDTIEIKGPKGRLERKVHSFIEIEKEGNVLRVKTDLTINKRRALQGLFRSLIANMVTGVTEGYEKMLLLSGIGYRAKIEGDILVLNVGYSNPVHFKLPEGIFAKVNNNTKIVLSGIDKEVLGRTASEVRDIRPPEPYKGKGIMYADEKIVRKAGKTAGKE